MQAATPEIVEAVETQVVPQSTPEDKFKDCDLGTLMQYQVLTGNAWKKSARELGRDDEVTVALGEDFKEAMTAFRRAFAKELANDAKELVNDAKPKKSNRRHLTRTCKVPKGCRK